MLAVVRSTDQFTIMCAQWNPIADQSAFQHDLNVQYQKRMLLTHKGVMMHESSELLTEHFDIAQFQNTAPAASQYERQLQRLISKNKDPQAIELAVRNAIENIKNRRRSFIIYGEPQSGKTEMMICLTAKLIDNQFPVIVHLLNDSVDLLGQNLGRFKASGLAPAPRNFSEVLDPAITIKGQRHIIFCKKNGADLRRLIDKLDKVDNIIIIDDEADYASPNAKINSGGYTIINGLISQLLNNNGIYIGVTATPARLDLNNTFDNDSSAWVNFPAHAYYTGQDKFFPLDGGVEYQRTLLADSGADPKHSRQALFSFLVNVSYLNLYVNKEEQCYSLLVHTSGKKADHKSDWHVMHRTLTCLVAREGNDFKSYTQKIWELARRRYSDADQNKITHYILDHISRYAIITLNSERDWKDNSGSATDPKSLFTIIIGGNIVSRGVTLNNLLSMFFTRDVKHKIQQDTYIQRARMFGSRGKYLRFFELTIPQALYVDWHRCFVFHRLALSAITDGLGSLVWLGDKRIAPVASNSIDHSTVDLDKGEMSFGIFDYSDHIDEILNSPLTHVAKITALDEALGTATFPLYLQRFIQRTSAGQAEAVYVHPPLDISNYKDADKENISRSKGFIGTNQIARAQSATHHVFVAHNGKKKARVIYKFVGSIQFIKNTSHDS